MAIEAKHSYAALRRLGELGRQVERRRAADPYPSPGGPPPSLEQLRSRHAEIQRAATAHGASGVRVFGSVARGQSRPDSDLDLLVAMNGGLFSQAALRAELEQLLGCPVHLVREGALDDPHARARIEAKAAAL